MTDARAAMLEGLNLFRALEAWGATLYARWADGEPDAELRAGHLVIAEREANHARLLAERLRALGVALVGCRAALARGFESAKTADPHTHAFWARLYSEERVSGGWYRATYAVLTGRRPGPVPPPVLSPEQVIRRAESASATAGEPAACLAVG